MGYMRQISILDLEPDIMPKPELWECMKSCVHVGEIMDHFPGTDKPRCLYGIMKADTGGKDIIGKVIDNIWHCWCKYYEAKPWR